MRTARRGLAALSIVLIVIILALLFSVGIAWNGLFRLDAAADTVGGQATRRLAESCLESAWLSWRRDQLYAGESLSLGPGFCIITVKDSVIFIGAKEFEVKANLNNYHQALRSTVTSSAGYVEVLDWRQVQDF